MAAMNQTRLIGYLESDPTCEKEGQITFPIKTVYEYEGKTKYTSVIVFVNDKLKEQVIHLKAYDFIDLSGIYITKKQNKYSICPLCGKRNVKSWATISYVYPLSLIQIKNLNIPKECSQNILDKILKEHYHMISNNIILLGNVTQDAKEIHNGYRFPLVFRRKLYIAGQEDIRSDYAFVYSLKEETDKVACHLKKKNLVFIDGIIRTRRVKSIFMCGYCLYTYQFDDAVTEIVPNDLMNLSL